MYIKHIPLEETTYFSSFFLDYMAQKPALAPFYSRFPIIENFKEIIEKRNFKETHRKVLAETLTQQYATTDIHPNIEKNLQLLRSPGTFTVTTGHQLNIFTGPLYFIYKIVTVINTCKKLKERYPAQSFVPIYWMASEDHDIEEINHFSFQNRQYQWHTHQRGAVGRFDPSDLIKIVHQLPQRTGFFKEAYQRNTLSEAVRYYMHYLFGHEGLVVLDADSARLKQLFTPVIKSDLFEHIPAQWAIKTTRKLKKLGYKTQVNCRKINLFYLEDGLRERIELKKNTFKVLNTSLSFSQEELSARIAHHPEQFSPNVILRPLYQEMILPNLAYVGGPSETVYWLQLKAVFDHFQTPFPLLMPRNFALIIPKHLQKKWVKTGLTYHDLFLNNQRAFSKWMKLHSDYELSFAKNRSALHAIYEALGKKAKAIDPTLKEHIEALKEGAIKKIEKAEKKLIKAEKRKHTQKWKQIDAVRESLFPNGDLQERRDNFLNFHVDDPLFVQTLLNTFDPFDYRMHLVLR